MVNWWTSTTPGESQVEEIDLHEFRALVAAAPPRRNMLEVILHHTWSPTVDDYAGRSTWLGIKRYHQEVRGWSDIGYHVGIAPDSTLWLLRPLQRSGGHTLGHNDRSIGVAMIGNFDAGRDDPELCLTVAVDTMAAMCDRFALYETDVWFHRNFADKSCPGTGINRPDVRGRVRVAMPGGQPQPQEPIKVIRHSDGVLIATSVANGNHIEDQGKLYVTDTEA